MKIEEKDDAITVLFQDRTGIRAKALYSFEAFFYAASAVGFFIATIYTLANVPFASIIPIVATVAFSVASWRYFSRVTLKESIQINEDGLIVSAISKGKNRSSGTMLLLSPIFDLLGSSSPWIIR